MYDYLTVSYSEELALSKLQARSFAVMVPNDLVNSITVVVNETNDSSIHAAIEKMKSTVLPEYGKLGPKVKILPASVFVDMKNLVETYKSTQPAPYIIQQIIKLKAAAACIANKIMVLDAKNFFVRTPSACDFTLPDGRLPGYFENITEHDSFKVHLIKYKDLFGVSENSRSTFLAPMTPFVLETRLCRELIAQVASIHGSLEKAIFSYEKPSEFLIYSVFLESLGILDTVHGNTSMTSSTLWPSHSTGIDGIRSKFREAKDRNHLAFGLHRRRVATFNEAEWGEIEIQLQNIGLLTPQQSAQNFLNG